MTGKGMAACVNRMARTAGMDVMAIYVPPEDDQVDGEIEVHIDGERSPYAIQIGHGYYALNHYFYGDDGLDGMSSLGVSASPYEMVEKLIEALK